MRVLVLGGTGEARVLAARLVDEGIDVVSSLAGQVVAPVLPAGRVRVGRFDDAERLAEYLRDERVDLVVDATHPFAPMITQHAVAACTAEAMPIVVLRRAGWSPGPGDRWTRVADIEAAARAVREAPASGSIFLTIGRNDLASFADDTAHEFVVRSIDRPKGSLPRRTTLLLQRGPFDVDQEVATMRGHHVSLVVTKDSGGPLTEAKLTAARCLELPVVIVDRPPLPQVASVSDVAAALDWVAACRGRAGSAESGAAHDRTR